MKTIIRIKLSVMMFLEFFIWGAWFVTLGTFLGSNLKASGSETAAIFSTQSWGAIIAPFIIGLIADRYFNAEKILGLLHLSGAFLMYQIITKLLTEPLTGRWYGQSLQESRLQCS